MKQSIFWNKWPFCANGCYSELIQNTRFVFIVNLLCIFVLFIVWQIIGIESMYFQISVVFNYVHAHPQTT